jgi:hypothetical protein
MELLIRKWHLQVEDTLANELGRPADGALLRKIAIAAVIRNPYAGTSSADLSRIVEPSVELGGEFGRRALAAAQGMPIQSYGKACLVGTSGEYEHGNTFLTTAFADPVRKAVGGGKA